MDQYESLSDYAKALYSYKGKVRAISIKLDKGSISTEHPSIKFFGFR